MNDYIFTVEVSVTADNEEEARRTVEAFVDIDNPIADETISAATVSHVEVIVDEPAEDRIAV